MRYSSPPVDAPKNQPPSFSSSSGVNPNPNLYSAGQGGAGPTHRVQGYAQGYPGQNVGAGPHGHAQGQDAFNFGAWGNMNDATAQMGVQFGKSAVAAGQDYVEKNFTRYLPLQLIKTSFDVTNSYVLRKIRLVLFPWRHKPWARTRRSGDAGSDGWQPPREDINAPDLYIPTMALVTYVLLCGLASGLQSRFHPEVLGASFFKAIAVIIMEFCIIKLGCYLLDVRGGGASGVELIGYGGYKFVGIITTVLTSFLKLGRMSTLAAFAYTFLANLFFLLRSLKYVLLPDPSTTGAATLSHAQRSRRIQFLFFIASIQILWMGWLSRV